MISVRCVARDLHTIAPGPLDRTSWRQFASLWGDLKISNSAFECDDDDDDDDDVDDADDDDDDDDDDDNVDDYRSSHIRLTLLLHTLQINTKRQAANTSLTQ